jgi:hypothetical protein
MPDHIIWQPINAIPRPLRHLRKAFRLRLILKRIAREINATAMYVCFDDDVHAANAVERYLLVFVCAPVAELSHVASVGGVLLVAFCKDDVVRKGGSELEAFGGFLPGVVVDWGVLVGFRDGGEVGRGLTAAFDVDHFAVFFLVSMEPDICAEFVRVS